MKIRLTQEHAVVTLRTGGTAAALIERDIFAVRVERFPDENGTLWAIAAHRAGDPPALVWLSEPRDHPTFVKTEWRNGFNLPVAPKGSRAPEIALALVTAGAAEFLD